MALVTLRQNTPKHRIYIYGAWVLAALAILLSATVLSALAAIADHSVQSAVQQRLAADSDIGVDVLGRYRPQDMAGGDRAARAALDRVFGEVPHHTYTALRAPTSLSSEYSLLRADGALSGASSVVVALPDPAAHARLTAGDWPQAAAGGPGAPLQTVLSQPAAARVGLLHHPGCQAVEQGAGRGLGGGEGGHLVRRQVGDGLGDGARPLWPAGEQGGDRRQAKRVALHRSSSRHAGIRSTCPGWIRSGSSI